MGKIDELLRANEIYVRSFKHGNLRMPPAKELAVLAVHGSPISRVSNSGHSDGRHSHDSQRRRHRD